MLAAGQPTGAQQADDGRRTQKLTVPDLAPQEGAGEKVVMASIPDYPSAVWAERAGIDIAAVGDSLGMINYGLPNTLPVTVDMMIPHAQAVRRGAPNCMVMVVDALRQLCDAGNRRASMRCAS